MTSAQFPATDLLIARWAPVLAEPRTRERLVVVFASIAFGLGTVLAAGRLVPVFLSVDGAHAITDARGLLGLAPRPPFYLPGFPALLVPLDRLGVDARVNVAIVLAIVAGLLFSSLYLLAREAASPRAALFGAIVAACSTSMAELLGWQGGATLFGLVGITAAFVAFLRWIESSSWSDALLVGLCLALTLASHPFMGTVGAGMIGGLGLWHLARERRFTRRGTGPTGLIGVAVAMSVPALTMLLLRENYLSIQAPTGMALRLPDPRAALAVIEWVGRESPALVVLTVGLVIIAVTRPGKTRPIAQLTVLVFVALPALLAGDPSYQTRVAYLLPPAVAIGGAAAWEAVEGAWLGARRSPYRARFPAILVALAVGVSAALLGFPQRLLVAVPYYSSLGTDDYALIQSLSNGPGTVAAGWQGNRYWDGLLNGWYVEGITNRRAIGPTDPALTTRDTERVESAEAWQLFSGASGIENGSMQVSLGPATWRADPAIAARINGSYLPLVFVADTSNDYGIAARDAPPVSWNTAGGSIHGVRADSAGRVLFTVSAQLEGSQVRAKWSRGVVGSADPWTIWIWPAYGLEWRKVQVDPSSIEVAPFGDEAYRDPAAYDVIDPRIHLEVSAGATIEYFAIEPEYQVQAIAIHVPAGDDLALTVDVSGTEQAGATTAFDQRSLLARNDVRTVVVWRDSGWMDRFSSSPCFAEDRSGASVVVYRVDPRCAAAGP